MMNLDRGDRDRDRHDNDSQHVNSPVSSKEKNSFGQQYDNLDVEGLGGVPGRGGDGGEADAEDDQMM